MYWMWIMHWHLVLLSYLLPLGCPLADWLLQAMTSIIWIWYLPCVLYPSTCSLHCRQHSTAQSMVTPWHVVNGGVELWKKSIIGYCCYILCTNVRADSQCFWSSRKIWQKCCVHLLYHFSDTGGVQIERGILLSYAFIHQSPTQKWPSLSISSHNLQNLLALGNAYCWSCFHLPLLGGNSDWPIALRAVWGHVDCSCTSISIESIL